jgi:hypothetical protein
MRKLSMCRNEHNYLQQVAQCWKETGSIEEALEEGSPPTAMSSAMSATVPTMTFVVLGVVAIRSLCTRPALPSRRRLLDDRSWGLIGRRRLTRATLENRAPFNDLVQFAAVKPDAAALWAIVDLNALSLRHNQRNLTVRAQEPLRRVRKNRRTRFNHVDLLIWHDGA